jgi:surface polysaccharide O-acyltransferase-like enzyme
MLAVIMIHVTSVSVNDGRFAFTLNQISRFAVPMFVLISGAALSLGGKEEKKDAAAQIARLAPVYLLWCLVYRSVLTPHLYFIVIITQMYALYPYLQLVKRKYPRALLILAVALSLLSSAATYLASFGVNVLPNFIAAYWWFLFPIWIGYFTAGLYVTQVSVANFLAFARKHARIFAAASVLASAAYTLEGKLTGTYESSIKPSLLIYVPLCAVALIGAGESLQNKSIVAVIRFLSAHSFSIYMCHPKVLYYIRLMPFWESHGNLSLLTAYVSCLLISLLFATCFDFVLNRIRKRLAAA